MHLQETLRPKTWNDLMGLNYSPIGTVDQKTTLKNLADKGNIRIMMFVGPPGTGKTSAAILWTTTYLHAKYDDVREATIQLGTGHPNVRMVNASGERGIDVIRNLVPEFISLDTEDGYCRVLIFDEADGLTTAAQEALKAITEQFAYNCIFIFCLNHIERIEEALISRSAVFYFDPLPRDTLVNWLIEKSVKYKINISPQVALSVVSYYNGDLRRVTNDFLNVYEGQTVTAWKPKPTYADIIFAAKNPQEKYLELAAKTYIDAADLIHDLFILNHYENPVQFYQALNAMDKDPMIAVLGALTALKR
jgi:DNA polymerase III delta prime subunit